MVSAVPGMCEYALPSDDANMPARNELSVRDNVKSSNLNEGVGGGSAKSFAERPDWNSGGALRSVP